MSTEYHFPLPEGMWVRDAAASVNMLGRLALGGPSTLQVVLDMERTVNDGGYTDCLDTWDAMRTSLGPEYLQREAALYQQFGVRQSELSPDESMKWWSAIYGLYTGKSVAPMQDFAQEHMKLRDGAAEFFALCEASGIPTTILSAGTANIIEPVLKIHGIQPTHLIANRLDIDDQGRILPLDPAMIIHNRNKGEHGHGILAPLRRERPNIILVGDGKYDPNMVADEETGDVYRIRVSDPAAGKRITTTFSHAYVAKSFGYGYDAVIGNNLWPVDAIVSAIARGNKR